MYNIIYGRIIKNILLLLSLYYLFNDNISNLVTLCKLFNPNSIILYIFCPIVLYGLYN